VTTTRKFPGRKCYLDVQLHEGSGGGYLWLTISSVSATPTSNGALALHGEAARETNFTLPAHYFFIFGVHCQ
jgi:hypothetical protein